MAIDTDDWTAEADDWTAEADDAEGAALAREEAKATFEYQVQRLREIDEKAVEILKANLLIIGVFVTGLSIVVQSGLDVGPFVNLFTLFGALVLLLSTAVAGVTYTASNLRGGVGPEAIEAALEEPEAFSRTLTRSYGEWIEYNAAVTAVNDVLVTVTVLLVIDAFVYLVAGIGIGVVDPGPIASLAAFAVLTLALGWLTLVAYRMDHIAGIGAARRETFEGVRLSKGASRKRGHESLRKMLRTPDEADDERRRR